MWLLVVAAGSGYLARCLQGSKRPRLFDQGTSSNDQELLSEEALKVKDRFEKLDQQQQHQLDEKESGMEISSLNHLPSFQSSGIQDARTSPSKLKCRAKTWPCWLRNRAHSRDEPYHLLHGGGVDVEEVKHPPGDEARHLLPSDENLPSFREWKEVSSSPPRTPDRSPMSSLHITDMPQGEASITLKTPLGDVSWQASKQDVERLSLEGLGGLPSVLDWTSMAATQKFGLEEENFSNDRSRRKSRGRARSRSREPSASATPMRTSSSFNPGGIMLPSVVRKRKAAPSILNGFQDSGYLAKEVLLYAMGMHVGVTCMLLYHHSEIEKLKKLQRQPSLSGSQSAARKLLRFDSIQQDDDDESTTSVVTVETKPIDQMAALEAELEAELELMELNLKGDDIAASENGVSSIASLPVESKGGNVSPGETQHWCVSPRDLDRRLHILLEERQAKQIDELEEELRDVKGKLQVKDEELRSWKNRVFRLTQTSLASPTEENELGGAMGCETPVLPQRPMSRKKWFSEDPATPPVNAVSGVSRCRVSDSQDSEEASELTGALERLTLSNRGPVSRSCVSVSELLQRENNRNGVSFNGGAEEVRMARRSSLGTRISDHSEAQFHHEEEHLVYVKSSPFSSRDRNNTKVEFESSELIRTVETKCRIEERFHGTRVHEEEEKWVSRKISRPRHSTGNMLASRNRNQRQRKRWFS